MLDITRPKGVLPPRTASMVRMQIQAGNSLVHGQRDGQLKLCVPPIATQGDSFRLTEATSGKGVKPLT
jgi:hypothetical protein